MKTMEQVEENLRAADRSGAGTLDPAGRELIDRARRIFRERAPIPCTRCGYCLPCPSGVNIPRCLELYNDAVMYEDVEVPRAIYGRFMPEGERAAACTACRECESKCPQAIAVSECLEEVDGVLGKGRAPKPRPAGG
jgi:predicted aldo/keto reductase-like oxidoreductase